MLSLQTDTTQVNFHLHQDLIKFQFVKQPPILYYIQTSFKINKESVKLMLGSHKGFKTQLSKKKPFNKKNFLITFVNNCTEVLKPK